jgi:hypothetical protein
LRASLESDIVIQEGEQTVTELSQERWDNGDLGRDDERNMDNGDLGRDDKRNVDNIKQALIPVTSVVHLDSTQGEHRYLYKNFWACMELE